MTIRLKPLAALLPLLFSVAAQAQQATALDPVVVTATRQAQRVSELLSDVTVIESEEIRNAGPTATLNDLLARQPGIEIARRGGLGTDSSIFMRGTNNTHTLVLVDGVRFGSATTGYPSWGFIPLEQVDRIEIVRGSCSSLYGSDAIGGVIQIFTKRGDGPAQFTFDAGYGTWNTRSLGVGVSGGMNGWRYSLQVSDKRSDSYTAINNPRSGSYNADKDGFQAMSSSGSLSYAISKEHELGVSYLYADGWNRYDGFPGTVDWRQTETVYGWNAYSRNQFTANWTSTFKIGQSADDGRQHANGITNSTIRTDQTQYQWQHDLTLPVGVGLFAVERVEQSVSGSVNYTTSKRAINSYLLGWSGRFDSHRLQLSARQDDNSQFGTHSTGSFAYGYQFSPAWRANLSYGSAFKAPSFNDLYWPGAGNPNLKPETSENREAAIHYDTGAYRLSLTRYENDVRNLVEWAPIGPGGLWIPGNVARARLTGTTLASAARIADTDLSASIDWQEALDTNRDKLLRYRAREVAKLAAGRDFGNLRLGAEVQASGHRYNDVANNQRLGGYAILNLNASYKLDKEWSVFARANNVFDKAYVLVRDYTTPGANVFVGVRYAPK